MIDTINLNLTSKSVSWSTKKLITSFYTRVFEPLEAKKKWQVKRVRRLSIPRKPKKCSPQMADRVNIGTSLRNVDTV